MNTNNNLKTDLGVAEDNFCFNLDYEEIHEGILRAKEDIKCGRYYDLKTGMAKLKRMLIDD